MPVVRVELPQRSYDIRIESGCLSEVGPWVADRVSGRHAVVITDQNVQQRYAQPVADHLRSAGFSADLLTVPPGEASKSVSQAEQLWCQLLDCGTDRHSAVVAVGGGVVGDLAGFIAATFARGVAFVQVPTTLLAQVDSSVGGKVGVNLPTAKNMVGNFLQPQGVLIDPQVLASLPDRQYQAGLAEVVKYGVILDADFFAYLEHQVEAINGRDEQVLETVISRCCQLKADVVQQDEREEFGLRAVLNYGHTFAHALETVAGYGQLLHGEAVAIGMLCASRLAERLGRIDSHVTQRQERLLQSLGLPNRVPALPREELMQAMGRDKKVRDGRLRFVLPTKLGAVELVDQVDPQLARQAFDQSPP